MSFRRDNKTKTSYSKISIGLASPEEILDRSSGEVLKPETINYRTYNLNVTVSFAKGFSVRLRIMSVIAENIKGSAIKV